MKVFILIIMLGNGQFYFQEFNNAPNCEYARQTVTNEAPGGWRRFAFCAAK